MFKCGRDEAFPDADLEAEAAQLKDLFGGDTDEPYPHFRVATTHKLLKGYLANILEPAYIDTNSVLRLPPDAGNNEPVVQSCDVQNPNDDANFR